MQLNTQHQLVTVVIGRIHPETTEWPILEDFFRKITTKHRGTIVHFVDAIFIVCFKGPSKALHYGLSMRESIQKNGATVALGIHIRECDSSSCVSDQTIDIVKTMLDQIQLNQILITDPVRQLLPRKRFSYQVCKSVFESASEELLSLFSAELLPEISSINEEMTGISFLDKIIHIIYLNSSEKFSLQHICKEIGVSERQLQRKLKELTKKSPSQFVTSIRLKIAKNMLLSNEVKVTDVAYKTGFNNPSYFTKCFKKEFGITPSELAV